MAEKKSNSKSKKKSDFKKKTDKSEKINKKTEAKKDSVLKTEHEHTESHNKAQKEHHVSHMKDDAKKNTWMIVSISLAVLCLILALVGGFFWYKNSNDSNNDIINNNQSISNNQSLSGEIELLILDDKSCLDCGVDQFAEQVKTNLFNNLVVKKVQFDSAEGAKIVNELNLLQAPIYLFSESADKDSKWSEVQPAFETVELNGKKYYMLNPIYIPSKVLIKDVEISENAVLLGSRDAKLTVTYITDFECPYCAVAEGNKELVAMFESQVQMSGYVAPVPELFKEYVETGKVNILFVSAPFHSTSDIDHMAALCAHKEGKFHEYSDVLWHKRSEWIDIADKSARIEKFTEYANTLGLNKENFNTCLTTEEFAKKLDEDMEFLKKYGVSSTPSFFIGRKVVSGALDYSDFKALVEEELK